MTSENRSEWEGLDGDVGEGTPFKGENLSEQFSVPVCIPRGGYMCTDLCLCFSPQPKFQAKWCAAAFGRQRLPKSSFEMISESNTNPISSIRFPERQYRCEEQISQLPDARRRFSMRFIPPCLGPRLLAQPQSLRSSPPQSFPSNRPVRFHRKVFAPCESHETI
jgi:hypothetical protein